MGDGSTGPAERGITLGGSMMSSKFAARWTRMLAQVDWSSVNRGPSAAVTNTCSHSDFGKGAGTASVPSARAARKSAT